MRTAPLVDRLRDRAEGFRFVGGAMDLTEARLASVVPPAAFVLPAGDAADPSRMIGAHDQRGTETWSIVLVLRALRTADQDQSDELSDLRDAVRGALLAWEQDGEHGPFQFVAGELVAARDGQVIWQDVYSRETRLRVP